MYCSRDHQVARVQPGSTPLEVKVGERAGDDMAIVAEMAADCGIALPQAGVTREICRALKPRRYKLDHYGV